MELIYNNTLFSEVNDNLAYDITGGKWGESLSWFFGAVGATAAAIAGAAAAPVVAVAASTTVVVCGCYEIGYWGARAVKEMIN